MVHFTHHTGSEMIGYILIGVVLGGAIGYGIAYAKFADAKMIGELRLNYKKLQEDLQVAAKEATTLRHENGILRSKAQELLDENEDYVKIVSELSRYYYHLKQAHQKVTELSSILAVRDGNIEKKIAEIDSEDIRKKIDEGGEGMTTKKFF